MTRATHYTALALLGLLLFAAKAQAAPILKGNANDSTLRGMTTGYTIATGSGSTKDTLNTPSAGTFTVDSTPESDVLIAELSLTLNGKVISGSAMPYYQLILTLTKPTSTTVDGPSIPLNVDVSGSTDNTTVTLTGLDALTEIALPDHLVLSNFTFPDIDIVNTGDISSSDYSGGTWTVALSGTSGVSKLGIYADVSVPEPSSIALLGAGLAGFLVIYRRKARRRFARPIG